MKKVLSLVLALVLVLGSFSAVLAAPSDVVGTEYEAAVDRLIQLGALDGYPDGSFKPANSITRAEFAAAVVKVKGLKAAAEAAKGLATEFKDVPAAHWASGYVGVAARLGLVNGMGDGTFAPESPVTYEQAVTMVIRALGYEPAAQARGAYPYGYLIVANENGLLDAVKGTQGLPASRGLVAQLLDNALEIPMMVQVGFGTQTTWAVSGTQGTKVRLLLDDLGFDSVEGRVVSFDADRNRVTLEVEGKSKVLSVNENFDFNYVEGLNIKAWFSGSKIIVYSALDEAKLVATSINGAKLVFGGKAYNIAKDAYLELNGDEKDAAFAADYAKVVLNDDNEVVWAKGYTFNGFLVVKELKDKIAYDFAKDEVDLAKYDVLKAGRTLELNDIEELDILFYNTAEKFAIVYNDSKEGEIERVYTDTFRFGGKVYTINSDAKYLDGKAFGSLTAATLDAMMDQKNDVEVFFNIKGDVVLVVGNLGTPTRTSFYGLVTNATEYTGRRGDMLGLDLRNEEGKVVSYDLTVKTGEVVLNDVAVNTIVAGKIVKLTVDKDNVPTAIKVESPVLEGAAGKFKLTASYVGRYKLQDSTIIFYGDSNKKVVKLGEAKDFTEIGEASIYTDSTDRVVVVVAGKNTNADSKENVKTDLVTRVRRLTSGAYEFTFMNGDRYVTSSTAKVGTKDADGKYGADEDYKDMVKQIVSLSVGETSGLITKVEKVTGFPVTVDSRSTGSRTITITGGKEFELVSGALLYDTTGTPKTINLGDLVKGDKVVLYKDGDDLSRFVQYVVRTAEVGSEVTPEVKGLVTYINDTAGVESFAVDSKTPYFLNSKTILLDKDGKVVEMGAAKVIAELNEGDQVEVTFAGDVMTIKRLVVAE